MPAWRPSLSWCRGVLLECLSGSHLAVRPSLPVTWTGVAFTLLLLPPWTEPPAVVPPASMSPSVLILPRAIKRGTLRCPHTRFPTRLFPGCPPPLF